MTDEAPGSGTAIHCWCGDCEPPWPGCCTEYGCDPAGKIYADAIRPLSWAQAQAAADRIKQGD